MAPEHKIALKCLAVSFGPVLAVMSVNDDYTVQQRISGLLLFAVGAAIIGSLLPTVVRARWRWNTQRELKRTQREQLQISRDQSI